MHGVPRRNKYWVQIWKALKISEGRREPRGNLPCIPLGCYLACAALVGFRAIEMIDAVLNSGNPESTSNPSCQLVALSRRNDGECQRDIVLL
jgi:hypothetical protein